MTVFDGQHIIRRCLIVLISVLLWLPVKGQAEFLKPQDVNLQNPPPDSIQNTMWLDYPVLIHHRTPEQIEALKSAPGNTPVPEQRRLAYQSIARVKSNAFASAIKQFSEGYIKANNTLMSELPEFGIFSIVSPIAGCSIGRAGDGFIDPCNGVRFNLAGKVINHPGYQYLRLTVPPHRIVNGTLVFLTDYKADQVEDFTPDILNMEISDIDKALFAIDFERLDILQELVKQNSTVLRQENSAGSTVLHLAAFHDTTLDYLLESGNSDINKINHAGYTALLFAIMGEKYENAEKLVKHGARFVAFSQNGRAAKSVEAFIVEDMYRDLKTAREIRELLERIKHDNQSKEPNQAR